MIAIADEFSHYDLVTLNKDLVDYVEEEYPLRLFDWQRQVESMGGEDWHILRWLNEEAILEILSEIANSDYILKGSKGSPAYGQNITPLDINLYALSRDSEE